MDTITSKFNGIQMDKHPGISNEIWNKTKMQLRNTEGARLFDVGKAAPAAAASTGASFAMPQGGSIEFAVDKTKREKAEAADAKGSTQSEKMKARWAVKKAAAALESAEPTSDTVE